MAEGEVEQSSASSTAPPVAAVVAQSAVVAAVVAAGVTVAGAPEAAIEAAVQAAVDPFVELAAAMHAPTASAGEVVPAAEEAEAVEGHGGRDVAVVEMEVVSERLVDACLSGQ